MSIFLVSCETAELISGTNFDYSGIYRVKDEITGALVHFQIGKRSKLLNTFRLTTTENILINAVLLQKTIINNQLVSIYNNVMYSDKGTEEKFKKEYPELFI